MIVAVLPAGRSSAFIAAALSVLVLTAGAVAAAEPAGLVGLWSNPEGSFAFAADGTVEVVNQGQVFRGRWAAQDGVLWVQLPAGMMTFRFVVDGDDLVLEDANGRYQLRRARPDPAAASPPGGEASAAPLDALQYLRFVEHYREMRPDDVAAHLASVPPELARFATIWEAFGADLHFAACGGSLAPRVVWQTMTGRMGCAEIVAQRREAINLAAQLGLGNPFQEAEIQRMQVVNVLRCSLGLEAPEVCRAYAAATAGVGEALAGIGQTIVDNTGACTERWEQQGNDANTRVYLGCW